MKALQIAVTGLVLLVGAPGGFGGGQAGQQQMPPRQTTPGFPSIDGHAPNDGEGIPPSIMERQERMRNDDRHKQLVADTNKLLELATELKTAVDKSNKDTLSVDVIKKADEIEKLAKSVRDKMKG